jgi:uncharacterized protein (DUF2062 family)
MNPRRWFHEHSLKVLAIRDTPKAIAGGVAIGMFFSMTPLFGFKTLLTILFAWLTRSNLVAALLASAAHNVFWPLMPLLYRAEYDIGYWLLHSPHQFPPALTKAHWRGHKWLDWNFVYMTGKYALIGSFVCAGPAAFVMYLATQKLVARHHQKQLAMNQQSMK